MAFVWYRAREDTSNTWLRFDDESMDELTWAAIWQHDLDVAIESDLRPGDLIVISERRWRPSDRTRQSVDSPTRRRVR